MVAAAGAVTVRLWRVSVAVNRGQVREIAIACGRVAMLLMACLALHADIEHGILHDFIEGVGGDSVKELNSAATTLAPPTPPERDLAQLPIEVEAAAEGLFENLVSDVVLQDIPLSVLGD